MHPAEPTRRGDYIFFTELPTRWLDNDIYGHVNNVNYYSFFDTAIATFLMTEGGLDPWRDPAIGFCVESGCRFRSPIRYPQEVTAGISVLHLGRSSVRYGIGLFKEGDEQAAADGYFVHVFVDRQTQTSAPIPARLRAALAKLAPAGHEAD